MQMKDFHQLFGRDYFHNVVMTVRNPYDRMESEYRMRAVIDGEGFWKAWPSFSLWLEHALASQARDPYFLDNHLRPQWEFLGSEVEVLKFETGLAGVVGRIADILEVEPPLTLRHEYQTGDAGIGVEWDLVDRLRVQEVYRKDFEIFGYAY